MMLRGALPLRALVKVGCAAIRGTPLLLQLFLAYYGVGSLFASSPWLKASFPGLMRLDAMWYVLLAFTLNFAAHEAEVLRGALLAVPRGELEAARSFGMTRLQVLRRVWLPPAMMRAYPILANDAIAQLKSTPVAFAVPVLDLMAEAHRVMQDRLLIYEPLILVAAVYLLLSLATLWLFGWLARHMPQHWQG
jgi:polar amino acid transport system permease protein